MIVYKTPTNERHMTIHNGTKTTSHDHEMNPSSLKARNMNCSTLTAQNNSNYNKKTKISIKKRTKNDENFTSNDLSCFTAQIHTAMLTIEMKINGINTKIHKCLPDSSLSHTNNSNMRRIRCRANDISIDL